MTDDALGAISRCLKTLLPAETPLPVAAPGYEITPRSPHAAWCSMIVPRPSRDPFSMAPAASGTRVQRSWKAGPLWSRTGGTMGSTTDTEGSGRRREWWVVGLLGLALGVSFGLSFGDPLSNHSLYLLEGLRQARPGLLNADWFLRETYQYHPRFSMLVALADRLGNLPWLLALGNVLAVAASLALVFRAFRSLDRHRALVGWLVAVLLFVVVDRTHAVAGSYFFSPSLQPATLATVALLAALVFFLEEAYLASGICLAVAGLLHINFLLLGFPFLGVAHLLLGRAGLLSRLLRQFALVSIVALFDLPVLIAATPLGASPADVSFARHVLMTIRARHHYDPHAFVPSLLLFAAWQLAACPLLREVFPDGLVRRRFQALYAASW
jgi:hypothetical protein